MAVVVSATSVEVACSESNANHVSVNVKFHYIVGEVLDEKTVKVSTRVNGWQYFRWMSI